MSDDRGSVASERLSQPTTPKRGKSSRSSAATNTTTTTSLSTPGRTTSTNRNATIASPPTTPGSQQQSNPSASPAASLPSSTPSGISQLLQAIYTPDVAMKSTVRGWIRQFETSPKTAMLSLINMLVQACGANYTLTAADLEQDISDVVKQLALMGQLPIDSTAAGNRARAGRLLQFLRVLIEESQERLLYEPHLAPVLIEWIVCLSASFLRSYRQLMTSIAGSLIQTLITIALERLQRLDTVKKLRAVEQARPKPSKARLEQFMADEKLYTTHSEAVDAYILLLLRVFMHRYRDVDASIRVVAVTQLGLALLNHPTVLLKDKYLRYIAWALNDAAAPVRTAALEACLQIYESPDPSVSAQLGAFTTRFLPRFSEMTKDVDARAAAKAIGVMTALLKQGVLDETKGEDIPRYIWDAEPLVRAAATAFVLEDCFADSPGPGAEDTSSSTDITKTTGAEADEEPAAGSSGTANLSEAELARVKEDNIQLLNIFISYSPLVSGAQFTAAALQALMDTMVDNFWPKLKCIRHWNSLIDLILLAEGSQRQLQRQRVFVLNEQQRTVAILMLLSVIRRFITGESASAFATNSASTVSNIDQPQSRDRYQMMRRRRAITESLCEVMPELLRVFGMDPVRVIPLLSIVTCLDPEQYTALRRSSDHSALLSELKQILARATDADVIQWSARALHVLTAGAHDALTLAARSAARELAAELGAQLESALRSALKLQTRLLRQHGGIDIADEQSCSDAARALPQLSFQMHTSIVSKLSVAEQQQCAEAGAAVLATARRLEGLAVGVSVESELSDPRAETVRRAVLAAILNERRPRRPDDVEDNDDAVLGPIELASSDAAFERGQNRGGFGLSSGSSSGSGEESDDAQVMSQPKWRTLPPPFWALGAVGSGTVRSLLRVQQATLLWGVAAMKSEGVRDDTAGNAEADPIEDVTQSEEGPKRRGRKKKPDSSEETSTAASSVTSTMTTASSASTADDRARTELLRLRTVLFSDCLRVLRSYSSTVTLSVRVTAVSALSEAQALFSGALEKTPYTVLAAPVSQHQSHQFLVQSILLLDSLADKFEKFQAVNQADIAADPSLLADLEDLGFADAFEGEGEQDPTVAADEEDYIEAQDAVLSSSAATVLLTSGLAQGFTNPSGPAPTGVAASSVNAPTPAAIAAFNALEKLPSGARRARALALQVALALAKVALYCPLAQAPGALSALMGLVSRFGEAVDAVVRHVARALRTRDHGAAALLTAQFEALRALFLSLPDEDTTPVEVLSQKFVLMHPVKTTARSLAVFHRLVVDFALDQPPSLLAFLPAAIRPFLMRSSIADTRYLATHFARQAHTTGLSKLQRQAQENMSDPRTAALWRPLDEFARLLAKKGFTFDSRVLIAPPELEPSVNLSTMRRTSTAQHVKDEENIRNIREAVLKRKRQSDVSLAYPELAEEDAEGNVSGEDETSLLGTKRERSTPSKPRGKSQSQASQGSQSSLSQSQSQPQPGRKSSTKKQTKRRKRSQDETDEGEEEEDQEDMYLDGEQDALMNVEEEEEPDMDDEEDEIISQTPASQRQRKGRHVPSLSSAPATKPSPSRTKNVPINPSPLSDDIDDIEDSGTTTRRLSLSRARR